MDISRKEAVLKLKIISSYGVLSQKEQLYTLKWGVISLNMINSQIKWGNGAVTNWKTSLVTVP
jgi:hypothetical protein